MKCFVMVKKIFFFPFYWSRFQNRYCLTFTRVKALNQYFYFSQSFYFLNINNTVNYYYTIIRTFTYATECEYFGHLCD